MKRGCFSDGRFIHCPAAHCAAMSRKGVMILLGTKPQSFINLTKSRFSARLSRLDLRISSRTMPCWSTERQSEHERPAIFTTTSCRCQTSPGRGCRRRRTWAIRGPKFTVQRPFDLPDLAAPKMSAAAGFHRNSAGRQLSEEFKNLIPSQFLAQQRSARHVDPMSLKHILSQIEPDCDNLQHDRPPLGIIADPTWHTDAVGGRLHHQSQPQWCSH